MAADFRELWAAEERGRELAEQALDVRAAARALSGYMRSDPLGERLLRVWESARVSQVIEGLARLPKLRRSFEARMSHLQEKIVFELGWRYFCQVVKKELTCGALLQREQAHAWRWRRARRAVRERSQRYRFKDRWRTEAARRKRSELSRREVLLELEEVV